MKLISWFLTGLTFGAVSMAGASFAAGSTLKGEVKIDGSSTVFPVMEAVAEEFQRDNAQVRVTVGVSGTGGGFKKFAAGELDIANASRPIKDEEIQKAQANKIDFIELPVAFDGLSIVIHPKNDFVKTLTFEDLKKIWAPDSKVKTWKDVNPAWPDKAIKLYGPGTDSGTFDYFTEEVNGKSKASRADYVASEDDNTIVRGIQADQYSLGYFGYSYYIANKNKLKVVPIAKTAKDKAIAPNDETINNSTYPLSRPLFVYVSSKSAGKPEVDAFVKFMMKNAKILVKEAGYIPMPEKTYSEDLSRFEKKVMGRGKSAKADVKGH